MKNNRFLNFQKDEREYADMWDRKRHMIELPYCDRDVSVHFKSHSDNRVAMVIPVFGVADDIRHHIYAKSAIYAALTFLAHTDLKERGVKFYFSVGDLYADAILKYMETAAIPAENIVIFSQQKAQYLMSKVASVFDPHFQKYEKVVLIDSDVYVHRPNAETPPLNMFSQLLDNWRKPFFWGSAETGAEENWHPLHIEFNHYQASLDTYWEKLSKLVERPVSEVRKVFHIDDRTIPRANGWFYGFDVPRTLKDAAFQDFFVAAQEVILQDESFMSAWIYKQGSNPSLWDPPSFWTEDPYFWERAKEKHDTRIYHLSSNEHLNADDTSMHYETWRDRWFNDMQRFTL